MDISPKKTLVLLGVLVLALLSAEASEGLLSVTLASTLSSKSKSNGGLDLVAFDAAGAALWPRGSRNNRFFLLISASSPVRSLQ